MQGKGIVRFFLIAFVVVSIIQFLFVLPTNRVERQAEEYAENMASTAAVESQDSVKRAARSAFLDSMSSETVLKIPLISSFTYQDLKSRQLAYGLDLKGGMSVVLQVDLRELIRSLANNAEDPTLEQALDNATQAQSNAQDNYVSLFVDGWRAVANGRPLAEVFAGSVDEVTYESTDGEVERILRTQADQTVNLTFEMLKQRIDKLGVTQPNVSLDAARDLITVELPGIDNPERARGFLVAAAALEFWDTYRLTDGNLQSSFITAIQQMSSTNGEREIEEIVPNYVKDSLGNDTETIASIDTFYKDPTIDAPLQLGGYGAVLGLADKYNKKKVTDFLADEKNRSLFPRDLKFVWSREPVQLQNQEDDEEGFYELYGVKVPRGGVAPLEGDVVTSASADPDPQSGEMQVSLNMDQQGAKTWAAITTRAAQNGNREVAIVLDNEVVSAPGVNGPIPGGRSSISGSFSTQEANEPKMKIRFN
ncbi:MAG: protein translocase subunit SecDF, partial [Bacteroidota bacterium]